MRAEDGRLTSTIDSAGSRLRRPTGLCVSGNLVFAVDIGAEAVRKYRYK